MIIYCRFKYQLINFLFFLIYDISEKIYNNSDQYRFIFL
jgi:hypothetical protein